MFHGGSFLKLADDNMDIQNPEAQNRAFFVSQSMLLPLVCASRNVPHRYDEGGGAEEGHIDEHEIFVKQVSISPFLGMKKN